ncbi:MAG: class I tRNA ligase family protein, partial [Candidatus Helarchaeota archaeon]|nr:class I tRNA ligase family protein [Candidatus Helarchaeota archaeon]
PGKITDLKLQFEDKWIISRINTLNAELTDRLDRFQLPKVPKALQQFFLDDLSRWYIRIIRNRTKRDTESETKKAAFNTLYYVLKRFAILAHPVLPLLTEEFYQYLIRPIEPNAPESVLLMKWPICEKDLIDTKLEEAMEQVKQIVDNILAIRQEENVKLRYPCTQAVIQLKTESPLIKDLLDIISNQANVKETKIVDSIEKSPNFKIKETTNANIALNIQASDSLKTEWTIKELQRNIQQARKKNKFHVKEFIDLVIICSDKELIAALQEFSADLQQGTGAKTLEFLTALPAKAKTWNIHGELKVDEIKFAFYFQKA